LTRERKRRIDSEHLAAERRRLDRGIEEAGTRLRLADPNLTPVTPTHGLHVIGRDVRNIVHQLLDDENALAALSLVDRFTYAQSQGLFHWSSEEKPQSLPIDGDGFAHHVRLYDAVRMMNGRIHWPRGGPIKSVVLDVNQRDEWTDEAIAALRFPDSVTSIRVEVWAFDRSTFPVQMLHFPPALESLTLGNLYNQPVKDLVLPKTLVHLRFGRYFNQPVDELELPASVRTLMFGRSAGFFSNEETRVRFAESRQRLQARYPAVEMLTADMRERY